MDPSSQNITLSELVSEITEALGHRFYGKNYWILAETSDIKNYPERGYCFVTLVEKEGKEVRAKMEAVIWRRNYNIIPNFEFVTGTKFDRNLKMLLNVEVIFNPVYGLRLEILEIDTTFTLGQLELERQVILHELVINNPQTIKLIDGQFITLNKLLKMPVVIQKIALITAPNSDGQRDFLHEMANNPYGYRFDIDQFLTQIQGKNADKLILQQLMEIEASGNDPDIVVIVRGGGSQLDFSAFETYDIGKAIAEYPKIIITGIGHERNVSIADLMCNNNLITPTKVAAFIIENNRTFEDEVIQLKKHIFESAYQFFQDMNSNLERTIKGFTESTLHLFYHLQNELEKKTIAIRHMSPDNILARGFAIVSHNGRIVLNPSSLLPGHVISVKMKKATLRSTITEIENETETNLSESI